MGTALATTGGKKGTVAVKYDPSAFDFNKMKAAANAASKAMDGKELSEGKRGVEFPGDAYQYNGKTNVWSVYDKAAKTATPLKDNKADVVLNYQQAALVWRRFVEYTKNGKTGKRPDYQHLTMLHDAERFPVRETLGDLDTEDWDVSADGTPMDPWRCVLAIPVRDRDDDQIDHIELATNTANRQFFYLYSKLAAEAMMHMGELPIVRITGNQVEFDVDVKDKKTGAVVIDKKTGKPKRAKIQLFQPAFETIGWAEMKECDQAPASNEIEASDDVGEVESRQRVEAAPTADEKPAEKNKKRKVKAVEDDEDSI